MGLEGYAAVLAQIALIAIVTAATSRQTVNRALETIERSLRESIGTGNRPSVISSQWYFTEALGLLGREADVGAVLHGYTTRGPQAGLMPAVRGREAQLHDQAVNALRAALGDERFEDLALRGAAMEYDTATDYTMRSLERILNQH